jgi:fengycin family lipopeptide synthetase B
MPETAGTTVDSKAHRGPVAGAAETEDTPLAGKCEPPLLQPVSRDRHLPLSFAQQRLWLLDRLDPGSPLYNVPRALRLAGTLKIDALVQALTEIVRRHEALRTTFPIIDEQPVQSVGAPEPFKLRVSDLGNLEAGNHEAEAAKWMQQEALRPFDLQAEWPFRAALLRLKEDDHVLMIVSHHIASDAWSSGILVKELSILYEAFLAGKPSPLPELSLQYADFAYWQRRWLQGEVLDKQLGYWKKQLGGEIPNLELPTDRPRGVRRSFHGATLPFRLPQDLRSKLYQLSRHEGATLFMTLLAAFQALLYRYTGQEEVLVGTVIANRNRVEVEGLIGFFVNTLVMKGDLRGNPTFRELLRRVRTSAIDAYDHQDLPFEKLVEELQPQRNLNQNPLFQVAFSLQNAPRQELTLPHLNVQLLRIGAGRAKFDLTLTLHEMKDGLEGSFEYSTDLFDAARIERMMGHYQELLSEVTAHPEKPVPQLSFLTTAERRYLLSDYGNSTLFPANLCAHQRFELQAEHAPQRVAVTSGDEGLTYEELNARANQLAWYLRARGLKPEDRVGVCSGRSVDLVIAILGILKAGGAYVPLDPGYPDDRLAFMLKDAGVRMLLGSQRYQGKLTAILQEVPTNSVSCAVWLDGEWEDIAKQSNKNLRPPATTDHLAYVIYTSGTTGKPKGVQVTHRNMVRLFSATEHLFQFRDRDVWTLFHSYAFDFSVWELWGALIHGGRLVVVPYLVSRDPAAFYDLLVREQVTVLSQTPSAFRQLIQAENAVGQRPLALRYIIFGGEALEMQSLRPWFDRHGDEQPRLVNMYGITETTVHVTNRLLSKNDLQSGSVIGFPIADLQVYVLDRWLQPLPIGIPGELFVGGAGLARGYLDRPEQTAERFVPHPFSDEPGARLYRTGDFAQLLPNRELEYLGRVDQQVKIRGFRVEPGEIESVLLQHPAVGEAVVCTREDSPGDTRLVAYLVASGQQKDIAGVVALLKTRLPEYMLPADIVWLDRLPLNSSGKLDRRALPAPDRRRPELGVALEAPGTQTEKLLATIWMELLGIDQVGRHDSFFVLGGHSVLAMQVLVRIHARLNVEVSLRALFDNPTLSGLAREIEQAQPNGSRPIPRIPRRPVA